MDKKTVVVLFGGQSSEHEVSCVSAGTVIESIDDERYHKILIGITKAGCWLLVNSLEDIRSGAWEKSTVRAMISPDAGIGGLVVFKDGRAEVLKVDLVFPVLHGPYGEDGTVQGLLELSGIPYVGCGVLSSAVSMDKLHTKLIVDTLRIHQAVYLAVKRSELEDMAEVVSRVEDRFSYPVFVKPSNAGSSRGVSKVKCREDLEKALQLAAVEDAKILVEEAILGREIECAVLQDGEDKVSGVGEILAAAEFYDYDAKYNNAASRTVLDPELPELKLEEIRSAARRIFAAVGGRGLARVDFFLEQDTNRVIFNEINTLPGFTSISMYPMLWERQGMDKKQLVEKLIQSAYARRA